MIYVRIEMWPKGLEENKRLLGEVKIANVGGTLDEGAYSVQLMKSPEYSKSSGVYKTGRFEGFKRRILGPYDLLFRALEATVGQHNRNIQAPLANARRAEPSVPDLTKPVLVIP